MHNFLVAFFGFGTVSLFGAVFLDVVGGGSGSGGVPTRALGPLTRITGRLFGGLLGRVAGWRRDAENKETNQHS